MNPHTRTFLQRMVRRPDAGLPASGPRAAVLAGANALLIVLALVAAASLAAEYGFPLSDIARSVVSAATTWVLYGFLLYLAVRMAATPGRSAFLRTHRLELGLAFLIVFHVAFPDTVSSLVQSIDPAVAPEVLTRVYLVVTQVIMVLALVPSTIRYSVRAMGSLVQPASVLVLSFAALITIGTGLLLLPRATVDGGFGFVDALFTSASAVCVTGLTVVDTASAFTRTGHVILLVLIQLGGLGIMTLTTFVAVLLGGGGSLKQYTTLQALLGEESLGRIRRTVVQIGAATLAMELTGAVVIWFSVADLPFSTEGERAFFALFHAVSAFCNAGFALTSDSLASEALRANAPFLTTIMVLVTIGGLGFPVLLNLARLLSRRGGSQQLRRLSLHARIVLITSALLVAGGAAAFFLLEQQHSLRELSLGDRAFASLFHSVSARTAGFNLVDLGIAQPATLLIFMALMWIGASPGSTGGGIKTTTIVVAILAIRSIVTGRDAIELFHRRIPQRALVQAFSTIALTLGVIAAALLALLLLESAPFHTLLFEVVSALGTVGLSLGITPHLSWAGKLVIVAVIFAGRVGVLALLLSLARRHEAQWYDYTEEPVHIT